jgi:hypothetical protein
MKNIENVANFLFLLAIVLCITGACLMITGFVLSLISTDSNTRRHNVKKDNHTEDNHTEMQTANKP